MVQINVTTTSEKVTMTQCHPYQENLDQGQDLLFKLKILKKFP